MTACAASLLAWARLWSPLAPDEECATAWTALELPGSYAESRVDLWNTFHVGIPQAPIPLLLHALLGRDGGSAREELMRVADYLELEMGERRLPADHLAPVCDLLAQAIERDEPALIDGLQSRYLRPWVAAASATLAAAPHPPRLAEIMDCFASDVG